MRLNLIDLLLAIWVVLAGGGFIVLTVFGGSVELETLARCVYVIVLAAGLTGLALRFVRSKSAS